MAVNSYSNEYLSTIQNDVFARMDSKDNNGNGDGVVDVQEAFNDLHVGSLFNGMDENSSEYARLQAKTTGLVDTVAKYAGDDGIFDAQEWADFINGKEWGEVLDAYHSSSNFAKLEMSWIDNDGIKDGKMTKGELKVGLFNDYIDMYGDLDENTAKIEELVDKYVGEDGIFTVAEYTALKNDDTYKAFLKDNCISPLRKKEAEQKSDKTDNNSTSNPLNYSKEYTQMLKNVASGLSIEGLTKGTLKAAFIQSLDAMGVNYNNDLESVIDQYAGNDGKFSAEEAENIKNNAQFMAYLQMYFQ